jgi:uncharacterized protein YegJ (DUF2314 family)
MVAPSARALGEVLDEEGEAARAIRDAVHRTMLWKYRTGRSKPDADTIALLHRLSDGRIAAHGWADDHGAAA